MRNLSIEKFNPTKTELLEVSKKYLSLEIKGIDDKQGYVIVNEARKDLKRKRVEIQKMGKELRAEANHFQKAVIKLENELVEIIEPIEIDLKEKQNKIDIEKEKLERMKLLPERKEKLLKIGIEIDNDFILILDDIKFESFYNEKNAEFLAEKERVIVEEKFKIEEFKRIEEAKEQARIEAEERAKQEIELSKQKAEFEKQEALKKAEEEKQAIIDEQNRKEQTRIEAENLKKQQEKDAQTKLEKLKKYQKFLKDNGYSEKTKNDFFIQQIDNKIILFKRIGELII